MPVFHEVGSLWENGRRFKETQIKMDWDPIGDIYVPTFIQMTNGQFQSANDNKRFGVGHTDVQILGSP